jgi:hypothetical protein
MKQTRQKPMVGDLVRIINDYSSTEAAGQLAVVVRTLGIECVVQPIGSGLSASQQQHDKPWWFARKHLEIVSAGR